MNAKTWAVWMGLSVAMLLVSAAAARAEDLIRPAANPGKVEIVSQKISDDGKQGTIVVSTASGIFRVETVFAAKLEKLSLEVRGAKACEGLTFRVKGKEPRETVELNRRADVKITVAGDTCRIEFGKESTELLRAGGELQFIDFYR